MEENAVIDQRYDDMKFQISSEAEFQATKVALTDLEVVCKLMQAYQLLGEVFQHESPMILNLMPECTELFLEQASMNFIELHKRMAAEA